MAHFAKIENNIVTQVIVADQDLINLLDGEWVQTSYNTTGNTHVLGGTPLRGNYAGIGFIYDRKNDVFYPPKPFNSWTMDNTSWSWVPPIPKPDDGLEYIWDEPSKTWNPI